MMFLRSAFWQSPHFWQVSFGFTYLFCLLGYATHGMLDACTSYGTQLLWPFTNHRYAFNTISPMSVTRRC